MQTGRRLAFDFGDVRTGVATSDVSGILATPHSTLLTQDPNFLNAIAELISEISPIYIAIGKPKHLSGNSSAKEGVIELFIEQLKTLTQIPIYLIDERMTTVSANRILKDSGKNSKESRKVVDEMAATGILESAMNAERLQGLPSKDRR